MPGWRERLHLDAVAHALTPDRPPPLTGDLDTIRDAAERPVEEERRAVEQHTAAGTPDGPVTLPPGLQPPAAPIILGRRRSVVASALMFALGAGVAYVLFRAITELYTVLVLFALALLIALTLNPLVELLQRGRVPRWLAAVLAWLLAAIILVTPLALAIRAASTQLPTLINNVPALINNAEDHLGSLGARLRTVTSNGSGPAQVTPDKAVTYILQGGQVVFDAVSGIFVVGALTLWILIGLPRLLEFVYLLVPASHRVGTRTITTEVLTQISRFMLANVLTSVLAGAATWVWGLAWGIPYSLLLGSLVAVLDLIPTVGSTIGGAIVSLVALTVSLPTAVVTLGFYIGFRLAEDYIIQPRALRYSVELPGVVTVPAVLIGGAVLGLPGALFAVPVTLVIRVLVRDIAMPALDKR